MPMLLRWQTELLSVNAVEMPAVRQLVTNSTQIAASVDRFARVAEQLPGQVSTEREEILKALQAQEKDVTSLMSSGTQFSASLNTTLTTLDALMKRFGVGETNSAGPPKTNAEPFRIQDYAQTAAQLEATARQLTELLVTLDRTLGSTNLLQLSAQVGPVVQQARTGGKEIVDYAFWKGILLVVIVLLAALIYRFLSTRLISAKH
jgi:ABC-type transporter Mla subunit MlaD